MSEGKLRKRSEIPVEDTWAIEDLYVNDDAWEQEFATLDAEQAALAAFDGHLADSGERLYAYLSKTEEINQKCSKLANYTMRQADVDTRNATYQAMTGRFSSKMVSMQAATSFETPQIMEISDETLEGFYKEYPALERYRRYLTNIRRFREHVLSPQEEKLLAAAGELGNAPDNIYGMLADADLKFRDAEDASGVKHSVTQGTFVQLEESQDRMLRKSAYESLYDGFTAFRNTAAGILDAQNKQLKFFAQARKYDSAFEAALDGTNVPTSVYLNLIETVHRHLPKMHRYVTLRKKLLGVDELHFYDIYTPLVPSVDKKIPYAQAKQTVYDALAPMGEEYRAVLKEGFDHRWIDVHQNEGKRSGAYSAGAAVHPFVLLN